MHKSKHRNLILGIPLFLLMASVAISGVFAPPWRGAEKTVYAEWTDWGYTLDGSGNYRFSPDYSGYGTGSRYTAVSPLAFQLAAPVTGPALEVRGTFASHTDVLKLNKSGLEVRLPGFLEGEYAKVRFEITYYDSYAAFNGFNVTALTTGGVPLPGYNNAPIMPQLVNSSQDGHWATRAYEFMIDPNPLWETIVINFNHYPRVPQDTDAPYIDSFSFDTIVLPEPTSLMFLALGGLLLRQKN